MQTLYAKRKFVWKYRANLFQWRQIRQNIALKQTVHHLHALGVQLNIKLNTFVLKCFLLLFHVLNAYKWKGIGEHFKHWDSWKSCGRVRCIIRSHLNRPPTQRIPTEKDFKNSKSIFHPTNPIFQWPGRVQNCRDAKESSRICYFDFGEISTCQRERGGILFSFTFLIKTTFLPSKHFYHFKNIWRSTLMKK